MERTTDKYRVKYCMIDLDGKNLVEGYDVYDVYDADNGSYIDSIVTNEDLTDWSNDEIDTFVENIIGL